MSHTWKKRKKQHWKPKPATRKEIEQSIRDEGYQVIETPKGGKFHLHPGHEKP